MYNAIRRKPGPIVIINSLLLIYRIYILLIYRILIYNDNITRLEISSNTLCM